MPTFRLTPAAELNFVADQNTLWPDTDLTCLDENGNPFNLENATIEMSMRETNGSLAVLSWKTSDNTAEIIGDDNNVIRLVQKTALQTNIAAKRYFYDLLVTVPGGQPVKYLYGFILVNPTIT